MIELEPGAHVTATLRLVKPLGRGGMGSVWLARHLKLASDVVVKFLAADLRHEASSRERFSREATAAAQLRSPHVVQVLDHGVTDDGRPYIVMERLEGHDLSAELRRRERIAPKQTAAIIEQVARALDRAHEHGIIHRDVKPANIFLTDVGAREPFVKLLDFGVAKTLALGSVTTTGDLLGTPTYMSPEQLKGLPADHRADLWSLGLVAFRCLTGRLPFDGQTVGELAWQVVSGPIMRPSEVCSELPLEVDGWFSRACARDPERRFRSARQLADALWIAVGRPDLASSDEASMPTLPSGHDDTVVDSGGPLPTAGSLRSSVASVVPKPPDTSRRWRIATAASLTLAAVLGALYLSVADGDGATPSPATGSAAPLSTRAGSAEESLAPRAAPMTTSMGSVAGAPQAATSAPSASAALSAKPPPPALHGRPPQGRPPQGRPPQGRPPQGRPPQGRSPRTPKVDDDLGF